jgi:geranylgeranylglycerol-phosphate geranylgeranyltransferase
MTQTTGIPTAAVLRGYVSLMRPMNAIVSFLAILSVGVMATGEIHTDMAMLLAAVAGMLIGSAGNIINDVFDIEIDRVNKPHRAIAAGLVSRKGGIAWAAVCGLAGIVLSVPLGSGALLIATGSIVILYCYSAGLKRVPLLGNVLVGMITGLAFIYGGYAAGVPLAGIVPAAFACLMNVGREILKDIEDMPGDRASDHRTFPLIAGERSALGLTSIVLLGVLVASLLPWTLQRYTSWYLPLAIIVDVLILLSLVIVWHRPERSTVRHASALLKWGMLAGILAFTAGSIR